MNEISLNHIYIFAIVLLVIILIGLAYYIYYLKVLIKGQKDINDNNNLLIKQLKDNNDKLNRRLSRIVFNEYVQLQTKFKQLYKPSRKLKVIVGDYMLESAIITNTVLKKLGFESIIVPTPEDIIDIVDSGINIDLIITNNIYKDSNLDGPHMLYELRDEHNCKIPVIILTVSGGKKDYFINQCGFNGYLTKPLKIENAIDLFIESIIVK